MRICLYTCIINNGWGSLPIREDEVDGHRILWIGTQPVIIDADHKLERTYQEYADGFAKIAIWLVPWTDLTSGVAVTSANE